ncbi:MAG: 1-acylglycerol-3-phosphate O-acyltransferase [Armatimonadetes bacterium]|nr:1-acylglycerol-3-phosphate O-acyltransferase [Armatimonadota bacterium]NIM24674.1 1-acylglycerol-3-phosphate O-acyltransferase [Armatimonadota bacterium]NIM68553.1 1-acylglycerol-3-phosphate O-acyltransferase [Armatimonadota bacterium]NIM76933.1 1-acylglycerol-3-phosphate O-acyltransferase [Armatimonadota bacterium]NIN06747.1 1-acylglycerol-3-phosphate O-acyltransferase [Armatimonadota bacterium]
MPKSGGLILAPNHISYLDPPLAGSAVGRPVYFMAKQELFSVPVLGWLIRRTHAFPVNRGRADRQALRKAQALLEKGEVVVMFPEGRRSLDGRLQQAELGLALIAARAKAPVVPMALIGSNRALPGGSPFFRPAKIRVKIGSPIVFDTTANPRFSREALQPFADRIMEAIRRMLPEEMRGTPAQPEEC